MCVCVRWMGLIELPNRLDDDDDDDEDDDDDDDEDDDNDDNDDEPFVAFISPKFYIHS